MWSDADMETRVLFQEMIIPGGIEFNIKERKFGTSNLSAFYILKDTQKASGEASESLLVTHIRGTWNAVIEDLIRLSELLGDEEAGNV